MTTSTFWKKFLNRVSLAFISSAACWPYCMGLSHGTACRESQQKTHGLPDGYEVLERLGHFEAFYRQVAGVEEVVDPLLAAAGVIVRLCLGQLIVMVWKAQICGNGTADSTAALKSEGVFQCRSMSAMLTRSA
ncbi:MAG: hypothetical protein FRX49_03107 [Trebouxia sp. A1-2]|nr:MAG: hypothetical protein FRX49_03107 [Trebouxia sp. A1-2]